MKVKQLETTSKIQKQKIGNQHDIISHLFIPSADYLLTLNILNIYNLNLNILNIFNLNLNISCLIGGQTLLQPQWLTRQLA